MASKLSKKLNEYGVGRLPTREQAAQRAIASSAALLSPDKSSIGFGIRPDPPSEGIEAPDPSQASTAHNTALLDAAAMNEGLFEIRADVGESLYQLFEHEEGDRTAFERHIQSTQAAINDLNNRLPMEWGRFRDATDRHVDTASIAMSTAEPYGWLRRLPSRHYAWILGLVALAAGFLDTLSFRVFRESTGWTIVGALVIALGFAALTHFIGRGLNEREDHPLRFRMAIAGLVILVAGSWALTKIRDAYLSALHKPHQNWWFLCLQLVLEAAAVWASFEHTNRHADALNETQRTMDARREDFAAMLGERDRLVKVLTELECRQAESTERHVQLAYLILERERICLAAFATTMAIRLGPHRGRVVLATADTTPDHPERLTELIVWLEARAERLGRPARLQPPPGMLGPGLTSEPAPGS